MLIISDWNSENIVESVNKNHKLSQKNGCSFLVHMVLTITAKVPTATSTAASLLCTLCRHLICSVIRQLCDTTVADVAVH